MSVNLDRDYLATAITSLAVFHGDIELVSGLKATYYLDLRQVTLRGSCGRLIGRVMLDLIDGWDPDLVGGLTMGADPIATAMMFEATLRRRSLDACVVRKTAKAHGRGRRVEGPDVNGRPVVAVEDTCTTGGSLIEAISTLQSAGAVVLGAAVLVDRATGAREAVQALGLEYRAAFTATELGLS